MICTCRIQAQACVQIRYVYLRAGTSLSNFVSDVTRRLKRFVFHLQLHFPTSFLRGYVSYAALLQYRVFSWVFSRLLFVGRPSFADTPAAASRRPLLHSRVGAPPDACRSPVSGHARLPALPAPHIARGALASVFQMQSLPTRRRWRWRRPTEDRTVWLRARSKWTPALHH